MAGAGYKSFSVGEKLTAANVNTYLMQQSVMTFASTAARDAAITAPSEGMFAYSTADDEFYVYSGSAWIPFDITWTAWTPTFTNYTQGSGGTTQCYYTRIGKTIVAQVYVVSGTASSVTGQIQVSLPVDHASSNRSSVVGNLFIRDISPATSYIGNVALSGSAPGKALLQALNASGTYLTATSVAATVPMTWADGDYFAFTIIYQGV